MLFLEVLYYLLLPQFSPHHDIDDFFDEFALVFLFFVFKAGGGFDAGEDGLYPIAGETAPRIAFGVYVTDFAGVFGADHRVGK